MDIKSLITYERGMDRTQGVPDTGQVCLIWHARPYIITLNMYGLQVPLLMCYAFMNIYYMNICNLSDLDATFIR